MPINSCLYPTVHLPCSNINPSLTCSNFYNSLSVSPLFLQLPVYISLISTTLYPCLYPLLPVRPHLCPPLPSPWSRWLSSRFSGCGAVIHYTRSIMGHTAASQHFLISVITQSWGQADNARPVLMNKHKENLWALLLRICMQ